MLRVTHTGMRAKRSVAAGGALALLLVWLPASTFAQNSQAKNLEFCNGVGVPSPESQIGGCTALIASRSMTPQGLAIVHNNRGIAYMRKKDYDYAIEDFNDAINLDPKYAKAFNNRGVAYLRKGEYNSAIESIDESIGLESDYAIAFANRAEAFQKMGDTKSAFQDYDAVIQLQEKYDKKIQNRPDLQAEWKRSLVMARNERCWNRTINGQLQLALADCNEALRLQPNVAAILDSRGLTYLKMGNWDAAVADYDSAIRLNSKLASSLYGRGFGKLKQGNAVGGRADISAAIAIEANIAADFARYGVK